MNVMEALMGKTSASGRDFLVQQDNGASGNFGYREGKWKLVRHKSRKATNVELRLSPTEMPELQLFDLEEDPNESDDLSDRFPEELERLNKALEDIIEAGRTRLVTTE